MLHRILSRIYEIPIYVHGVVYLIGVALWVALDWRFVSKKWWSLVNCILAVLTAIAITCVTLLWRDEMNSGLSLSLTALLLEAKTYPDIYREMALNVMLFFPLGLTMPFALPSKMKYPVIGTMALTVLLSVFIELSQWGFSKGYAELWDVLLNTSGAFIGTIAYMLRKYLIKKACI